MLSQSFQNPPPSARPWVFWFWINGNISKEGITADLEAMKRVGIGGMIWMEVSGQAWAPDGKVVPLSPQWHEAMQWAIKECARLGLEFDLSVDFGYGSGGPHITPEISMQQLVWSEKEVEGGQLISLTLEKAQVPKKVSAWLRPDAAISPKVVEMLQNTESYRDVAVVAIPMAASAAERDYRIPDVNAKAGLHWRLPAPKNAPAPLPGAVTPLERVIDLTASMDREGRLQWNAPPGKWTVIRYGHASNLKMTRPCPAAAVGLECDRLAKAGIEAHYGGFLKKIFEGAGEHAGKSLTYVHVDSWEAGCQNWTASFPAEFRSRRGYDLRPWLPVLTGRVVGSPELSERFLWDIRATVGELIQGHYLGRLRELAKPHGIRFSTEGYGHMCIDNLTDGGNADFPISEFWARGNAKLPQASHGYLQSSKAMASAAHTYGRTVVGAESFTADRDWRDHPYIIKSLGDWAFCQGVNRMIFHLSAHQPYNDMIPGMTHRKWGEHFDRFNTWFEYSQPWMDYVARCQFLLQQGEFVGDVCYWFGEGAPLEVDDMALEIPAGYDYDLCPTELVRQATVRNGRIVLPSGISYRYLRLPESDRITLPLLRKVRELVEAGARVIGDRKIIGSPSLADHLQGDTEIPKIASALWDGNRIISGKSLAEVFAQDGLKPDFEGEGLSYFHRRAGDDDLYFVANGKPQSFEGTCTFRVAGKRPELWQPDTGRIAPTVAFQEGEGVTRIPMVLGPSESVFVVFRPGPATERIVSVTRNGQELLRLDKSPSKLAAAKPGAVNATGTFTMAAWTKPSSDTALPPETTAGTVARLKRNDALYPPPGHEVWGPADAGVGFAVGRNGVCVHEHGASCFSTSLRYPAPLTNWTHVAVVYREATPTLYLDGKPVHTGLKSRKVVHPGVGVAHQRQVAPFVGELAGLLAFDRALTDSEIAELAKTRPAASSVSEALPSAWDLMQGLIRQSGEYVVQTAGGQTRRLSVALPPPQPVSGPWQVSFDPKWGGPAKAVEFPVLTDWSKHADSHIHYYSGTAVYRTTFTSSEGRPENQRLFLDLGSVEVMARVKLNGTECGIAWKPPYFVDVTRAVHAGKNELEIDVVNLWVNRLIGDEQLPDDCHWLNFETLAEWPDWFKNGTPRPSGRYTFTSCKHYKKDSPLLPSGLLGPVQLQALTTPSVK